MICAVYCHWSHISGAVVGDRGGCYEPLISSHPALLPRQGSLRPSRHTDVSSYALSTYMMQTWPTREEPAVRTGLGVGRLLLLQGLSSHGVHVCADSVGGFGRGRRGDRGDRGDRRGRGRGRGRGDKVREGVDHTGVHYKELQLRGWREHVGIRGWKEHWRGHASQSGSLVV